MKQFFTVLKFELMNYLKSKSYITTTCIISAILIIGLTLPTMIDFSNIFSKFGSSSDYTNSFAIYDKDGVISNADYFKAFFPEADFKMVSSEKEIEDLVNDDTVEAGFVINTPTSYTYLVKNSSMSDSNKTIFEAALSKLYRDEIITSKGLNPMEMDALYNLPIESDVTILGKDSVNNFAYTYILIFFLYFLIIFYGQMIAVSVTTEKSNRAMEVLVTSTSSNSLIFGKVIATTIASVIQSGTILLSGILTYKLNSANWGGKLDMLFDIPLNVIGVFAAFGILGYLFYAFIFGAVGALVSKPEDVNSSAGTITFIYVAVFLAVMFGMTNNPESMLMKVLSYVPFSSCMAMFVRVSMGSVSTINILISLAILIASTLLTGVFGAKIYRRGTLMYGNPVKLRNAVKWLKKEKH